MAFERLRNSIRNTCNIADGWKVGRTIIENGKGFIQLDNGEEIELQENDHIELLADDKYVPIILQDLVEKKTNEGWPLFAGFDARVKR